jgi:hypothetical protein
LRFGSEWAIARPCVGTTVYFPGDAELFVDTKDSRRAICDHIVLCEQLRRGSEDRDAQVAEGVEPAVTAKLLTDKYRTVSVCLI